MNPSTRIPRIDIAIRLCAAGVADLKVRSARQRAAQSRGLEALRSYASPEGAALFEAAMGDDGADDEAPVPARTESRRC